MPAFLLPTYCLTPSIEQVITGLMLPSEGLIVSTERDRFISRQALLSLTDEIDNNIGS